MIQNREALLGPLSEAVRQAGRLFDDRAMAGQIRQKGPTDFVTSVDVSVQALLKARLAELAPEVQFMGEEQDNAGVDFRRPVWILDPVGRSPPRRERPSPCPAAELWWPPTAPSARSFWPSFRDSEPVFTKMDRTHA